VKPVKHGRAVRQVESHTEAGKKAMYEQLMEEVVRDENAAAALRTVVRNKGVAGIDHMRTEELAGHLKRHWGSIKSKLLTGYLCANAGEAGRNTQAGWRKANAGDTDGAGPVHSADAVERVDPDL
jgi:hypothetical protein